MRQYEVCLFEGYVVYVDAANPEDAWDKAVALCPDELLEENEVTKERP